MPNTYFKLHIQLVFAVKYRTGLIHREWKEDLHKYINFAKILLTGKKGMVHFPIQKAMYQM